MARSSGGQGLDRLIVLHNQLQKDVSLRLKELDLTLSSLHILRTITDLGQKVSQARVAEALGVSEQSMSLAMRRLKKLGYVSPDSSVRLQRGQSLAVTVEGSNVLTKGLKVWRSVEKKWLAYLGVEQRKQLLDALHEVQQAYERRQIEIIYEKARKSMQYGSYMEYLKVKRMLDRHRYDKEIDAV